MKETILIDYPHASMVRVTLNRPETGNAYDDEMVCALITAFDEFKQDEDLKLICITAEGDDFCRGLDSSWHQQRLDAGRAEHQNDSEQLSRLFHTLYQMPIPTLATVRGEANAAAVGLICCCDIVLACESSSFTIMEMEYGQVPALQSPYLVKAIGERAARYYALSGEKITSHTALQLGLIHKLVPKEELELVTELNIQRILRHSNLSLRQTKSMINLSATEAYDESLIDTLIDCSTDIRVSQMEGMKLRETG
ncbi:enoyl-CoA hydratase-related protein [Reinekea marinisedimentorum]|uniref:Methylglutaconyl-CoA hydratase n=1 Tax=Reinekea marinisedimentorum TaxID=230495 RepID=A0A4R3IAI5_9GAMM|nr:enoyl-CoA hydratase-related protein [Reinekea marinisedimentorum]TCS42499.1 methylglutaconyl-CoA hydratase [Reinekea marinisedimentorum]